MNVHHGQEGGIMSNGHHARAIVYGLLPFGAVLRSGCNESSTGNLKPLIRIRSSADRPQDAFVAIRYRDHWFWIDDRDLYSKRTFSFLMLIFTLTESGGVSAAPIVTVPAH